MALSNIVAFFIILTAADTLHAHGATQVTSAAQAAQALAPFAGKWAAALFACGMIGTGMLAIPVLSGSAAFAMGEALHWRTGLEDKPEQAPRFYLAIAIATVVGMMFNFFGVNPIRALVWAAMVNGILAAPVMAVILHMARRQEVMGKFVISRPLLAFGLAATLVMLGASLGVFATGG
jgi:Mn2+/Fe2+ NRAMP family transporter